MTAPTDGFGDVVKFPTHSFRWITEAQGGCPWCAIGECEFCASTSAVPAPCACCGPESAS